MDATKNGNYVCTRCEGTDLLFHAQATYNTRTMQFELQGVLDEVFCKTCNAPTKDEWREPHE